MPSFRKRLSESVKNGIAPALLVLLFVAMVAFLRDFKPQDAGFDADGSPLRLYHACRLGLMVCIGIFSCSAGYWVLELFRAKPQSLFTSGRKSLILCFFLGASVYGLVLTALGLAGLITLESALVLTVPALMFCRRPLQAFFSTSDNAGFLASARASPASARLAMAVLLFAAALFVLTRVLFVAPVENNVWEHYLHYYRLVLDSGSTQPNEVWHHFYGSKGAGLIFLANVLSDFFGAQLVSACFIFAAALIVLDLLLEYCASAAWAMFGSALLLIFMYGEVADGATLKHHALILGYMSFTFWGVLQLQRAPQRQVRPLTWALIVVLAYFGFYQPVAAVLLPAAFVLFALVNVFFREKPQVNRLLALTGAVCAGTLLVLGTNYMLTGLAEVTPMRWLWAIADQAKAERVFGLGGIEFFLSMNNDLARHYDWSFDRTWKILRYPLPKALLYLSLVAALIVLMRALIRYRSDKSFAGRDKFLAQLGAFVLPLSVFAQLMQTAAVDRMALYSIVFTTLAVTVIWHGIVVPGGRERGQFDSDGMRAAASTPFFANMTRASAATLLVMVCGLGFAAAHAWRGIGRHQWPIIMKYDLGVASLRETMQSMEALSNTPAGMTVSAMAAFRKTAGGDGRVLSLTYEPGYSYSLPGAGVVSEPTYSIVRNPQRLLTEKPGEVADYLHQNNIQYLALDLRANLFTTIAFTPLFDSAELAKYFRVAYQHGDFFILTWRQEGESMAVPDYLFALLALKRSGVLHYPFTDTFAAATVRDGDQGRMVDTVDTFKKVRDEFREDVLVSIDKGMARQISGGPPKILLERVMAAGIDAISAAQPDTRTLAAPEPLIRRALNGAYEKQDIERIAASKLRARLLDLFRDAVYKEYEAQMGIDLASLFRRCDERVPFAGNYPADASCR